VEGEVYCENFVRIGLTADAGDNFKNRASIPLGGDGGGVGGFADQQAGRLVSCELACLGISTPAAAILK
jgi:hypothetical protein